MTTADVIQNALNASTTTRRVKGTTITVTRAEPAPVVTVVDETVQEQTKAALPVDASKRVVEVLPGMSLVMYGKGYCCLRVKGKAWGGQKVTIGRPLYRDDIKVLVEALFEAGQKAKTYEEANPSA
jgi:hypothetical protein